MENRSKRAKQADSNFKAMGKGERTSKKVSTIRTASGTSFRRKNANQYGAAEGGNDYTEKRVNRTDSFETGGTADSAENGGANLGGTLGSSMMKRGGEVGQVKAKAWIITEEGGLPKVKAYKTIMEAHDNVFKQGGHKITSLSRLKDVLSAKYDINNIEPYMYVKQMANGGGLANVPESFPETDAMSYKNGGGVGNLSSNAQKVLDRMAKAKVNRYKVYDFTVKQWAEQLKIKLSKEEIEKVAEAYSTNPKYSFDFDKMANGGGTKGFEYSIGGL